jgi:hypothetical protein
MVVARVDSRILPGVDIEGTDPGGGFDLSHGLRERDGQEKPILILTWDAVFSAATGVIMGICVTDVMRQCPRCNDAAAALV